MATPTIYGLTGGIAAGKSEAAKRFTALGIPVINLDAIGTELLTQDAETLSQVLALFPEARTVEGGIDRRRLRDVVFNDPLKRARLESALHPRIWQRFFDHLQTLNAKFALCEAALLIESGSYRKLSGLVVVMADEKTRLHRLVERDGIPEALAARMIAAQTDDETRRKAATILIQNDGDTGGLTRQVDSIFAEWKRKGLV